MTATPRRRRGAGAGLALLVSVLLAACAGSQPRDVETVGEGASPLDTGQPGGTTPSSAPPGAFGGNATTGGRNVPSVPNLPRRSTGTPTPRAAGSGPSAPAGGGSRSPTAGSPTPTSPVPVVPTPATPPPGGNGGATDVGVTADTIKLGGFYVESGPMGSLGITLLKAVKAVYNEVNAQGGIFGRKIQLVDCDTSFTSGDKPRACFDKLAKQDKVFAFASAGDGPAMVTASPLICKEQIPAIWMDGLASDEFTCPFIFPTGPPGRSQSHVLADYYAKKYKPKTVGFLVQNDDIGNEWLQGAKEVFAKFGVKVVAEQRYNLGDTNLNGQVINMQAAQPDFVFFANEPLGGILFQLQAKSLGYTPPMPAAGVTCNVEIWPREVGEYAKGMVCQHPWSLPQDGLPEHGIYEKTYKKYWNDWDQRSPYTEIHWVAAKAVVETLEAAGPNLTRARVLEVLRSGALNGFDTGFGVKFKQSAGPGGGNIFDTEVAVIEITEPSGKPHYYEMRQPAQPDPYFTVG